VLQLVRPLLVVLAGAVTTSALFFVAIFTVSAPHLCVASGMGILCLGVSLSKHFARDRALLRTCGWILALWAAFDAVGVLRAGDLMQPIRPRFLTSFGLARFLPQEIDAQDPFLGKRNVPGAREAERGIVQSIDDQGLRISPPPVPGVQPSACVLFFGCSFTYGDGVSDSETFAYQVELRTGGRVRTRNFGVGGGAPHYALAQVESGMVQRTAQCTPTHAVFLLIPHHVFRSSGKSIVRQGPAYELRPDGSVVRVGTLNRTRLQFVGDVLRYTSGLYVALYGYDEPYAPEDFRLTAALLRTLNAQLSDLYPGIQFHVLYWDQPHLTEFDAPLRALGLPVHEVSSFIPSLNDASEPAYLPDDHHPNVWAHGEIARYIIRAILKRPSDTQPALDQAAVVSPLAAGAINSSADSARVADAASNSVPDLRASR
jgi:hypothetical protein